METSIRTTIVLASITAVQGIAIAAITAGWNLFGLIERGEDPATTVAELQLTTDVFPLVRPGAENCIGTLRLALEDKDFQASGGGDDVAIMRRGAYKMAIWCRPSELVITVAGRRGSATDGVLEVIESTAADVGLVPGPAG